jgi:hypothetical protein
VATGRLPDPNSSPLTAKGDLYTYSTVPAKLAVGSDGDTLLADSSATTGLRWGSNLGFTAGKNRIINGNMTIDQRNSGSSVTLSSSPVYLVDRWNGLEDTDGVMTAQQDSSAPSGFAKSLKFTTTTADTSLSASQQTRSYQFIEGSNVVDFAFGTAAAKTVTLSFWVRSSLTGTFAGSLREYNATRSYVFTYSISSADTWEYKTITIPGDTSGTYAKDNLGALAVIFNLGSGSNYQTTANQWTAGSYWATSGAVSVIGTLNATWYVTGVQLEIGSVATAFQTAAGTIAGELAACQRYYYRLYPNLTNKGLGVGFNYSTTASFCMVPFPVTMRIRPTAVEQSGTASHYSVLSSSAATLTCTAVPTYDAWTTTAAGWVNSTVSTGLTAGNGTFFNALTADAYLGWSAEL